MASKKHYPVVRKTELLIGGSADTKAVIRVDRVLSARNHRLYRQSRGYVAKVDLHVDAPVGTTVDVYAIGDSWMAMKAYQLAKKTYDNNSKEEREQAGTMAARWNDFRVDHGLGTLWQKDMLPTGWNLDLGTQSTFGTSAVAEYEFSKVADASSADYTFRWSGTGANTYNIIDEYDATGNAPQDPSAAASAAAYSTLEDDIDDGQMAEVQGNGNIPPYNRNTIENQIWVKIGTLSVNATGQQKLSTGFFVAPAGLIAIESSAPLDPNTESYISLEVQAGDYKGVRAPSLLE